MRRAFILIVCLLMTPPLQGQTSQPTSEPGRIRRNPRPTRPGPRRPPSLERDTAKIAADLGLDEDQRTAMTAILEVMRQEADEREQARAQAMETRSVELAKARQEILLARRAADRKRVVQLKEKIDEIRNAHAARDPYKVFFEKISAILTDEQKARLPELTNQYPAKPEVKPRSLPNRKRVTALILALGLTDDQKEAVEAVDEAFALRMTTTLIFDPDEYNDFKLDFVNALVALLNDEQRKKFEGRVGAAFFESSPADRIKQMASRPKFMFSTVKNMDLTAPQKEHVARVERDFAERLANRKPRDVEVNRKLRRDIKIALGKILTNEQLEKFEQAIEKKRAQWTEQRRAGEGDATKPADEKAEKPKTEKPEKPEQDKPDKSEKPEKPKQDKP